MMSQKPKQTEQKRGSLIKTNKNKFSHHITQKPASTYQGTGRPASLVVLGEAARFSYPSTACIENDGSRHKRENDPRGEGG